MKHPEKRTTKVFMNGRSQAVRIPKEYRFETDEVYINKIGDIVYLAPANKLKEIFDEGIAMFSEDFLADGIPGRVPPLGEDQ